MLTTSSENNYRYTRTPMRVGLQRGIRFVYASSAATYGDGSQGYSDDDADPHPAPLNMYGYSKHLFDLWALKTGCSTGSSASNTSTSSAPTKDHKGDMRSVVSKAYEQIGRPAKCSSSRATGPSIADGEQMRDFVYVKDAVAVTLHLPRKRGRRRPIQLRHRKSANLERSGHGSLPAMNLPPQIEYIPMPEHLRGKYQYFTEADMGKLRSAGYKAEFHTLEDAVADYIATYYDKLEA